MSAKEQRAPKLRVLESVRLDLNNQCLWRENRRIALRPKDYAVLRCLVEHAEQMVTKAALLEAVWPGIVVTESVLKACINRLRQALSDDAKVPHYIETIHRLGYRFLQPIPTTQPVSSSQYPVVSREKERQKSKACPEPSRRGKNQKAKIEFLTPAPSPQHPTPFLVGREAELAQLHKWLDKALNGERQIVFVTGEPGIGKTTLVEAFLSGVRGQGSGNGAPILTEPRTPIPDPWIIQGQCIAQYGTGEAYLPVLEAFERLCRPAGTDGPIADGPVNVIRRHAPVWLAQLPALSDPAERLALQRQTAGATRERMMRECARALEVLTAEKGLVLWMDDLQWSDGSTLSLLDFLARRRDPARLLLLGTYRPSEVLGREHPLAGLKRELQLHNLCQELPVTSLTEDAVAEYLTWRFADGIEAIRRELARLVYQRTEGNPLFMVNVVNDLLANGVMVQRHGRWELQRQRETGKTPASIRQFIEQQVEWLSSPEQEILAAASVAGMEFSAAAVAAALSAEIQAIEQRCAALVQRELFLQASGVEEWPDGTVASRYRFLHALHQEIVYARLTAARRFQWHQQVGLRKEHGYGTQAREIAVELAVHFEQGRDYRRAVRYLEAAAQTTLRRRAPQEAIMHLIHALELLKLLPDTPERAQQELSLLIALGVPLLMTKGYAAAEVGRTYALARALCQQIGDTPQLVLALTGLCWHHLVRAELQTARAIGEQLLPMAQRLQDPVLLLQAHLVSGIPLFHLGEFAASSAHLQQALALCDSQPPNSQASLFPEGYEAAHPEMHCRPYAALVLYYQGYAEQARKKSLEAVAFAQARALPFSLGSALVLAAVLHQYLQEEPLARERAEAAITLSSTHGFPHWLAQGMILQGWALARQGQQEEGVSQMRQGLAVHQATGIELARAYYLTLLAETLGTAGQPEEGLALLAEAENFVRQSGERFFEAELYRLRGELTLRQANQKTKIKSQKAKIETSPQPLTPVPRTEVEQEAEKCFLRAIDVAQKQQAKSFELRATISLVRLRQQQAKDHVTRTTQYDSRATLDEDHHMLSEIYHWFTEGFDTTDLQEAKALLQELGRSFEQVSDKSQTSRRQVSEKPQAVQGKSSDLFLTCFKLALDWP